MDYHSVASYHLAQRQEMHNEMSEAVLEKSLREEKGCERRKKTKIMSLPPAYRWKKAIRQVCSDLRNAEPPRFAVDKLNEFERLFQDAAGDETDLDPEAFIEGFHRLVGGHFLRSHWMRLFNDIDADRGGTVSWDEFTTFMVHQAVGLAAEYRRSKELVPLPLPKSANAHKEPASILLHAERTEQYVSAGSDGTIRVWNHDLSHEKTIFNSKLAASSVLSSYVSTVPICDMTICGGVCSVASVDKCVNLFNVDKMHLIRRYIGRNLFNDISIPPLYVGTNSKPIDTCILMGMTDALSSVDLQQTTGGRELFFSGLMDGTVLVHPTQRLSMAAEIRPALTLHHAHKGSVTKVRYEPGFHGIISTGWDAAICVADAETGSVLTRFDSIGEGVVDSATVGHSKAIVDMCYQDASKTLATVSNERDICLWNPSMATPIQRLTGHTGHLLSVRFNDVENQMVSLSNDNMMRVWDLRTFRSFQTIVFNNPMRLSTICCDPSSNRLIGMAGVPYGWCIRRTFCGFPPSYRAHIEPVVGLCYHKELDILVSTDVSTNMTWEVKDGTRLLVWDGVEEPQRFAAACLDFSGRRLCAVTKDGAIFIYNHRSGQLLREEKAHGVEEVMSCVYLSRLPNHIYLAVVAPNRVVFFKELADNDFHSFDVPLLPGHNVACGVVGLPDSYGVPTVVMGTVDGGVIVVSATQRCIVIAMPPPPPVRGDPLQEFVGDGPIMKQLETILVLPLKSLILTVCGDRLVYLWGTGKKGCLLATCAMERCYSGIVALAVNVSETRLFCGDDSGFVHVYDIECVPTHRKGSQFTPDQFVHLRSIHSHRCPITKILCLSHREALIIGGQDLKLRLYSWLGKRHGTFGEEVWSAPKSSTVELKFPRRRSSVVSCLSATFLTQESTGFFASMPSGTYADGGVAVDAGDGGEGASIERDDPQRQGGRSSGRRLSSRPQQQTPSRPLRLADTTTSSSTTGLTPLPSTHHQHHHPATLHEALHRATRCAMTPTLGVRKRSGIVKSQLRSFTPQPHVSSVMGDGGDGDGGDGGSAPPHPSLSLAFSPTSTFLSTSSRGTTVGAQQEPQQQQHWNDGLSGDEEQPGGDVMRIDRRSLVSSMWNRSPTRWRNGANSSPTDEAGTSLSPPGPAHLPPVVLLKQNYDHSRSVSREWARPKADGNTCRGEQRSETSRRIFDAKLRNPSGWCTHTASFLPLEQVSDTVLRPPEHARRSTFQLPSIKKRS